MSDSSAQEPTMEEILASIRRIISEDDAPAGEPAAGPAAIAATALEAHPAAPAPAPASMPFPEPDDVLELTQRVPDEPVHAPPPAPSPMPQGLDDLEAFPIEPEPAIPYTPPPSAPHMDEALISNRAADTAATHFGALAQTVLMPAQGRSLEDVVRELLRPMLKDWLDTHLTTIVETQVQAEVERISRRRVY